MHDLVPRDSTAIEIAPISKTIAARQESTAISDLQAHYRRHRNGFSQFSEELIDQVPAIHLLGFFSISVAGVSGITSIISQEALNGGMIGLLAATGALGAAWGSMLVSKIRTGAQNRRALAPASAEAAKLEDDLARWLKSDYDLTMPDGRFHMPYLAKQLLHIEGVLNPTKVWAFRTSSGAAFEARIVQRADGSLELHRPSVAELSEDSLIQPIRKSVEL